MKKIGKYEILENLGEGGVGTVFKAYDPLMKREVAIKVLQERAFDLPEIKDRFYREAQSAGKLSHENVTIVHDLGEVEGNPYIVMEYLSGTDLREIIKSKRAVGLQQKLEFAIQICAACAYSHTKGIVHRDIKPENIRVLEDGKIKIMDFGIAKAAASTMTQTGTVMGTPYYMSPEQIRGLDVDKPSDIWSFGVVLYELLSYKLPFTGDSPTTISYKIVHEAPQPLDYDGAGEVAPLAEIINNCLQKDPEKRYHDFSTIQQELQSILKMVIAQEETEKVSISQAETQVIPPGADKTVLLKDATPKDESPRPQKTTRKKKTLQSWNKPSVIVAGAIALALTLTVFLYQLFQDESSPVADVRASFVSLNIIPWAEVTKITTDEGREVEFIDNGDGLVTPCRVSLPPGSYVFHLSNPTLSASFELPVTTEAGKVSSIRRTVPDFDAEEFLSQLE